MLKFDPIRLIFNQGDVVTKLSCLEFFGLGDSPRARTCLANLIGHQRPDGSFPSLFDPETWGMRETVRNTLLLLKVGLPPVGVNVDSAVRFVLAHQRPDGGWSENQSLQLPAELVELSNQRSVTWLTADVVELLHRVGKANRPECRVALEWLRVMQNQHGGWYCFAGAIGEQKNDPGDPDSTAQITFLMGEIYGENEPVYLKGRTLFESYLNKTAQDVKRGYWIRLRDGQKEALDVYHLTHLLLSWLLDPPRRIRSGYDVSDSRVQQMMEALIEIQCEDGGWRPFWAEESDPGYTLLAVKVLVLTGAMSRGDFQATVKTYTG